MALQLSHNLAYLDLESTLEEQSDELEGFRDRYSNKYWYMPMIMWDREVFALIQTPSVAHWNFESPFNFVHIWFSVHFLPDISDLALRDGNAGFVKGRF